jgi:hypothetical protein
MNKENQHILAYVFAYSWSSTGTSNGFGFGNVVLHLSKELKSWDAFQAARQRIMDNLADVGHRDVSVTIFSWNRLPDDDTPDQSMQK